MAFHLYSRGKAVGPYLALAPIFPTNLLPDIRWGFDAIWNISIITTNTAVFEYTIDGGITWFPLITVPANTEVICNVKADDKDSFNLRTTLGATVFRILISIAPEDLQRRGSTSEARDQVDICPVLCDVPIINGSVSPLDVQVNNEQGTPVGKIIASETNFAILQDTDIFTATAPVGTSAGDAVVFRVQWSAIDGGILRYTLNDSDFVSFNDQNALKEDSSHIFDVIVEDGDLFTLQFEKDTTITFLRVIQLI